MKQDKTISAEEANQVSVVLTYQGVIGLAWIEKGILVTVVARLVSQLSNLLNDGVSSFRYLDVLMENSC